MGQLDARRYSHALVNDVPCKDAGVCHDRTTIAARAAYLATSARRSKGTTVVQMNFL
jgi:hypothetical protein